MSSNVKWNDLYFCLPHSNYFYLINRWGDDCFKSVLFEEHHRRPRLTDLLSIAFDQAMRTNLMPDWI